MSLWYALVIITLIGNAVTSAQCPQRTTKDEEGRMCYKTIPYAKNWVVARDNCMSQKGDLISNLEARTVGIIKNMMQAGKRYWIGLNDRNQEGNYTWLGHTEIAQGISWLGGQPPANDDVADCGSFDGTNVFIENCAQERAFICAIPFSRDYQRESTVHCPNNFGRKYGWGRRKCMAVFKQPKTWQEAKAACERMHRYGTLAYIHNFQYHDKLNKFRARNVKHWTGFNDMNIEGQFRFLNRTEPLSYFPWYRGNPSTGEDGKDCVNLMTADNINFMETSDCNLKMGYICQICRECPETENATMSTASTTTSPPPPPTTTTTTTTTPPPTTTTTTTLPPTTTTTTTPTTTTTTTTTPPPTTTTTTTLPPTTTTTTTTTPTTTLTTTTTTPSATTTTNQGIQCSDAGWKLYEGSGICFMLMTSKKNWDDARDDCISQEADLAVIPDQATHQFIKDQILDTKRSWIGLRDTEQDGKFKWLGGIENTQYRAWRNPPKNLRGDEYCVEIIGNHEGKWNDKRCDKLKSYICQKDANLNA